MNFRYKEASGSQNWTNISDIVSSINNLRSSFQDGCNAIYNQCVTTGITPSSNSPDAICAAITAISNTAYTNGYNAGKNNPTSSGTYKISFSGKMHPPGDGSNWINVSDAIYIRVTGSSVVIDTNYISLANGQVNLNVAKVQTATFCGQQGRISRTVQAILSGQPGISAGQRVLRPTDQY